MQSSLLRLANSSDLILRDTDHLQLLLKSGWLDLFVSMNLKDLSLDNLAEICWYLKDSDIWLK